MSQRTSRRSFVKTCAAVSVGAAAGGALAQDPAPATQPRAPRSAKPQRRPHIVLLMTDQQKASATGCYGNPLVPSRFQDQLFADGVGFRHAYSCSAVCTPSRASIMTGVHPLVHQATCVQHRVPWNLPQLAELMAQAGYYTAACGHHEPRRDLHRGWHTQVDQNAAGSLHKSWIDWMMSGRSDVGWSAGPMKTPADQGNSAQLTDWMLRTLDVALGSGAPLFLHLALNDPHPPYWTPEPYASMIDPRRVSLPPAPVKSGSPPWHERLLRDNGSHLATEQDVRRVIATYYGMIGYADDQMRRIYDAFAAKGLLEDTWFIFTSDHGDYTGEHGAFAKSESLYECLLHVPLIIRPPAGVNLKRGQMTDGLVELSDLFPTILRLAGAEVPDYAQGHDLLAWLGENDRRPLRDCAFAQVGDYHGHLKTTWPAGLPESGRHKSLLQGARSLDFRYTRDPDYGDEAYDLRSDPHELVNLINPGSPPPPAQVDDLRRKTDAFEQSCLRLREQLKIHPGDRGFWDGIQYQPASKPAAGA